MIIPDVLGDHAFGEQTVFVAQETFPNGGMLTDHLVDQFPNLMTLTLT